MIEFPGFTLKIEPAPVRHYLGYPDSFYLPEPVESLLIQEIEQGCRLVEPKGGYVVFSVGEKTRDSISFLEVDFTIESRGVLKALKDAEKVVLFLVTIGPALEAKVKEYHRSRQITRGRPEGYARGPKPGISCFHRWRHSTLGNGIERRKGLFAGLPRRPGGIEGEALGLH